MVVDVTKILLLAVFVESMVQWAKGEYRHTFTYLALLIGVVLAYATQINFLQQVGITDYSWHGIVGTLMFAAVTARGSNFVNDLYSGKFTTKLGGFIRNKPGDPGPQPTGPP